MFPILHSHENLPKLPVISGIDMKLGCPLLELQIEPKLIYDESQSAALYPLDFNFSIDDIQSLVNKPSGSEYAGITIFPLGTASAIPSKYRNVSGTLVSVKGSNILLDCGEGTYGQLCRRFGNDVSKILRDLHTIFISHLHADHHLGVFTILIEWKVIFCLPLANGNW
jgi:hypothetical protein